MRRGVFLILTNLNIFYIHDIFYFVSRVYKNMSPYEVCELTVLRQIPHITQCILDKLSVKVKSGTLLGGPQEKFYRIFVAMINIVAYGH